MRTLLAATVLLGTAQWSFGQEESRRFAVIFDAGSIPLYEEPFRELQKLPESPTGSLVDAFSAQGYRVSWVGGKGLSRSETLRQLYQLASDTREGDTVVVYAVGYAVRHPLLQGGAYWIQENGTLATLETTAVRIEELTNVFQKVRAREKLLLLDFVFLGDAVFAEEKDAKMQMQRQMRFYPEVSLVSGSLPLTDLEALGEREPLNHVALALSPAASSRLGNRGLLGTALRGAVAGEADRNLDGELRAGEMVDFLRGSIASRASAAGLSPTDFQLAAASPQDFPVAAAGTSVSRARRGRYLAILREWRDRNWISVATELAARSVLDQWIRSVEERTPLDFRAEELWGILQNHLEGSANEIDRARSLEAQMKKTF